MTRKTVRSTVLCLLGVLALAVLCKLSFVFWAEENEAEQLMEILAAGEPADAAWAFEVLKSLPDDRLDLLLPHLSATDMVPVSSFCWTSLTSGGGMGQFFPRGRPLGAMVRFLLWTRLVRPVPVMTPDPACWTDEPARPGAIEEIRAAWLAHRASMTLEAGPH